MKAAGDLEAGSIALSSEQVTLQLLSPTDLRRGQNNRDEM